MREVLATEARCHRAQLLRRRHLRNCPGRRALACRSAACPSPCSSFDCCSISSAQRQRLAKLRHTTNDTNHRRRRRILRGPMHTRLGCHQAFGLQPPLTSTSVIGPRGLVSRSRPRYRFRPPRGRYMRRLHWEISTRFLSAPRVSRAAAAAVARDEAPPRGGESRRFGSALPEPLRGSRGRTTASRARRGPEFPPVRRWVGRKRESGLAGQCDERRESRSAGGLGARKRCTPQPKQ